MAGRECRHYIIALQVGSGIWPSGLAVLEQVALKTGNWASETSELNLRYLERIPAGTPFPGIARRAHLLLKLLSRDKEPRIIDRDMITFESGVPRVVAQPPTFEVDETDGGPTLICGVTTVGPAAVQLMRSKGLTPVCVTITNGIGETEQDFENWRVSRAALLGDLKTHLETGKLAIADGMDLRDELLKELGAVRLKAPTFNPTDPDSWSQTAGDDLVFAAGLAVWWAGKQTPTVQGWSTPLKYKNEKAIV